MGTGTRDWPLWSTTARLVVTDAAQLDAACAIVHRVLASVDAAASRFRADSELQRIAPRLHSGVEISDTLVGLVRAALDSAAATDGDVDPTLGYAMGAAGYDRDFRLIEDDGVLVRAIESRRPGWKSVVLAENHLRVPAHLSLDLGSTAKAVAADRAAHAVVDELGGGALVSLGGDIATAGPEPDGGWHVLAQDAVGDPACMIRLSPGWAIATSSTQKRTWSRGGEPQHHILNPRTGRPADAVWRSVTVVATTCLRANTLATASIVRGHTAMAWLGAQGVSARLVDWRGRIVALGDWPESSTSPLAKSRWAA
ncbi:FAD:protein FMN transferase [Glaciihabitans sp. dw_435]|uniref:FAD:protein FMN transferase n=1 Tax=Glaciihabitans sp. dw_435 TaxID=2720081 RepID=UPI001BD51C45|nr:FAD:protein FMN transferase [Glaciihabitans sp. dw_435]